MNLDQLIRDADPAAEFMIPDPDSPVARHSFERVLAVRPRQPRRRGVANALAGVRARVFIGAAVAAAAAVAVAVALPSSPAVPTGPPAGHMATAPADLTAAAVLDQAARAAVSKAGWPDAQYWYTKDQYVCGGKLYTDQSWNWRHGNGVTQKTGPRHNAADPLCSSDLYTAPIIDSYTFGPYTWSQLFTLPTQPAALKAKLTADFGQSGRRTLFEDVGFVLIDTPAPPAVRGALFKVAAGIAGVRVIGRYTDPLGRTGIALRLGRSSIVVDPASGVVIDATVDGSAVVYVTQGPANGEPRLTGSCVRGCASATHPLTEPSERPVPD